jgi:hypothetical protein
LVRERWLLHTKYLLRPDSLQVANQLQKFGNRTIYWLFAEAWMDHAQPLDRAAPEDCPKRKMFSTLVLQSLAQGWCFAIKLKLWSKIRRIRRNSMKNLDRIQKKASSHRKRLELRESNL